MPVKQKFSNTIIPTQVGPASCRLLMIDSTNVEWIAWSRRGEPLMIVEFKGGGRYAYIGVSRQRAVAAAYHASTGKYINERIKPHFEVVKLR
jgi:hypothetical protein